MVTYLTRGAQRGRPAGGCGTPRSFCRGTKKPPLTFLSGGAKGHAILHDASVVSLSGDGQTILRALERDLQVLEALIGLELGVRLAPHEQARQQARHRVGRRHLLAAGVRLEFR